MMMRKIGGVLLVLLCVGVGVQASLAESITFSWSYTPEEQVKIVGFKLYVDGKPLDAVTIAPEARTVTIDKPSDKLAHAYFLVAYSDEETSDPSDFVIDSYVPVKPGKVQVFEVVK